MAPKSTYEELEKRVKDLEKYVEHYKKTEQKLRESDYRYQSLIDNAPVGIWHASPGGAGGFINSKLMEITGLIPESAQGTNWASALYPEDRERVFEEWTNFVEGKAPYHSTYRFRHPNGEVRWVIGQAVSVIDTDSCLIGYIGTLTDITDRKQAEEALRENEERYRSLFELSADGIVTWQDEKAALVNPAAMRMYGAISADDIIGKSIYEVHPADYHEKIRARFQYIHETGLTAAPTEYKFIRLDGQMIDVETTGTLINYKNRLAVVSIYRDISERKKVEEELQKAYKQLETKAVSLEEANIALKVLLQRTDADKTEVEEKILLNVKELVVPYLDKVQKNGLDDRQNAIVDILKSNLNNIISPFLHTLSSKYSSLTPKEIQVANLVKEGKTTKDISELLTSSTDAIEFHRKNIRKKLGLQNTKTNLRSYLLSYLKW